MNTSKARGAILNKSFEKWGKGSISYGSLYITLSSSALEIAKNFFEESPEVSHGHYEMWWFNNNHRFVNRAKQRELLLLHEIIVKFITDYAHGRIANEPAANEKEKKTRNKNIEL